MNSGKKLGGILLTLIASMAMAQPSTEVYLFDLMVDTSGYSISNPLNVSNNEGYDNQPSFWPDGGSIIYARTVDGQTEIARYFLDNKKTKVITKTGQGSEYSPTPMPDGRISSIRLDTTGLQLLYAYDLKGKSEVLVPELVVGYHTWISDNEVVTFVLGEPFTMQIIDTESGESRVVYENIGRSLHKVPNTPYFSFVDKSRKTWAIKAMNPENQSVIYLTNTLENAEDYCWTPDGKIIMGQGNQVFVWDRDWTSIADITEYGLEGISRLALSPDGTKLVLVVNQ